jgi:hypothetical protein
MAQLAATKLRRNTIPKTVRRQGFVVLMAPERACRKNEPMAATPKSGPVLPFIDQERKARQKTLAQQKTDLDRRDTAGNERHAPPHMC